MAESLGLVSRYGMRTEQFSELMAYRVREVLLVASRYDAFVLEEDGELSELISQEYRDLGLNVRHAPRFAIASSAAAALDMLAGDPFDLVVTTARLPDMPLEAFARAAKAKVPGLPLGVLAAHAWDLPPLEGLREAGTADWIFLWQGGVRTLLAMIEQEEDRRNADHDIAAIGVQAIILVEDDTRFLSFLLPHIYTEVTQQTARLMAEGLNLSHRLLRLQARPKILVAQSFEEAWELFERYSGHLLGVISDVSFPREGRVDPEAGLDLVRRLRAVDAELPMLVQSSDEANRSAANALGAAFIVKDSPNVLDELRTFMLESFGFGDFVFTLPDGTEVGRASDTKALVAELSRVPAASLEYHASRNHFSRWFKARTEFELATILRPSRVSDFASLDELRTFLSGTVVAYLREIQRHVTADFGAERFDEFVAFARIGSGSLGGKGRGLAFMQKLLAQERPESEGVEVAIPQTVVLASDVFEEYMEGNGLQPRVPAFAGMEDEAILDTFRTGRFTRALRADLARFLTVMRDPIAVRSSSLLEDSLYQPFAGVYATVMLPNNHPSLDVRLAQLLEAIKLVYASTYMRAAREYVQTTPHRAEEERMSVLLQRLVGSRRHSRFYPLFSGVASSYNFYPFRQMKPEDGVALVAVGLGKSVVEGFEALRFCPAFPQVLPQFSTTKDILRNAQRRFWALDMSRMDVIPGLELDANLARLEVTEAFGDLAASALLSTYVAADDAVIDRSVPGGTPLVTFSRLLKGRGFPLAEVLAWLLRITQRDMGVPVEIEFAVDLAAGARVQVFHALQIRPMLVEPTPVDEELDTSPGDDIVAVSSFAMGHGRRGGILDVVVVRPDIDRARTPQVTMVLESLNGALRAEGRPYLLVGPGRWGSRDPWLGIPVVWSQISGVRAIVETDFADFDVEPSQGSHFFHNLTSFGIPFLAIHTRQNSGSLAWSWLDAQPAVAEFLDGKVRHLRLERSLDILVDGARRQGVIRVAR